MTSKTIQNPSRRDFLKTVGVASTVTAAACSVDPISWDPLVPQELAYPYVIQPEAVVPGVASRYSTRCNQCSNSCGVVAKVREGRVINLEGNDHDPFNMGKLCGVGQSALLENYSPDRIKKPQKAGVDTKITDVVKEVAALIKGGAKPVWIGRNRSGASAAIVDQFVSAYGGSRIFWEPLGSESQRYAVDQAFGGNYNTIPTYNMENAETIISFGAEYLGDWGHNVKNHMGWADSRDSERKNGAVVPRSADNVSQTISVGPRIGLTETSSDIHLFCNPGTEALVAFALAKKLAEKISYKSNAAASAMLSSIDAEANMKEANVNVDAFNKAVARLAATKTKFVALPGGVVASMNESTVAIGALLLNEVGGSFDGAHPTVQLGKEDVSSMGTAKEIFDVLSKADSKTVLFVDNTDLVFQLGKTLDVAGSLAKFGAVVHFLNESNDSVAKTSNCYVIPKGTSLETWGDAEVFIGNHILQQPAMRSLADFDIISAEDVLLGIAQTNGTLAITPTPVLEEGEEQGAKEKEAATEEETEVIPLPVASPIPDLDQQSFYSYLKAWWKSQIFEKKSDTNNGTTFEWSSKLVKEILKTSTIGNLDFTRFWIEALKTGGVFSNNQKTIRPAFALSKLPANKKAVGNTFLFPHPQIGSGTVANRSWLQETPDPITTFSWATWIEVNPKTAKKLGLTKPKGASIVIDNTTLNVGWFGSPGIKEDQFAIVMGNGHKNSGRYARYGANPVSAMKLDFDPSGALVYPVVSGNVVATQDRNAPSHQNELVKSDTLTRNGRGVNHTVSIEDIGKGEEKLKERLSPLNKPETQEFYKRALEVEHASIVPEHHLPVDSMAVRARHTANTYNKSETLTDMYPEPDHPTYRFAMAIDLNRCNGCGSCEAACYAENNIPVVGPEEIRLGRRMGWMRLSRYWESPNAVATEKDDDSIVDVRFQPVMCQQCSHAPCEGVCPVLATYHNLDGLNAMVYNRCVGTRYCANNCPYSARRFNFHTYRWPESFNMMLNPDVLTREMGVMEKCTFCVQKIREWKDQKRDKYEFSEAQKIQPTDAAELQNVVPCGKNCPSGAITFGNKNDLESKVSKAFKDERGYLMLGELNNKPGVAYLARIVHTPSAIHGHGEDHGDHSGGHGAHDDHKDDGHGHKGDGHDHKDAGHKDDGHGH